MTDDFAPPPAPDGGPTGTVPRASVQRADFRPAQPPRRRSRFPRWVAVLLGVGALVIGAGVVAQVTLTARNGNLTPSEPDATGRMHSAQVVSGMCIESLGESAGTVRVVSCDDAHSAEVVSSYVFTTADWPGDAAVQDTALAYCAAQLAPGGPLAAAADGRDWVAWVPSAATWQHGDRTALCIVTGQSPWTGKAT